MIFDSEKIKVAFFFGAGCEISLGLPGGLKFLKDTFFCEKTKTVLDDIHKFFDRKKAKLYFDSTYNHGNSILLSSGNIYKRILNKLAKISDANQKLNDADYIEFEKIFNDFLKPDVKSRFVKSKTLIEIFKNDGKKEKVFKSEFESKIQIVFGEFLDGYFHTIINPKKYGSRNFSKVFNYYWSCFFSIVDSMLLNKKSNQKEFEKFFTSNGEVSHLKIFQEFSDFIKLLYSEYNLDLTGSYYDEILNQLDNPKNANIVYNGLATTNYYDFAEKEFKNFGKKTAYLNGKLKWLEFPECLEVEDVVEKSFDVSKLRKYIFFPFIFGQSYLKPVVDKLQTEEFHKLNEILNDSNVLVILGYNINEDDNHINSFLHSFLVNSSVNKILFVTDEDKDKRKNNLLKQLKIDKGFADNVDVLQFDYMKQRPPDIVKSIFSEIQNQK